MSGAVRSASGTQGGGGVAVGGGASASRGAPADGASFGGVLGAAISASHGTTDGNGKGKGADAGTDKNGGSQTLAADPTTLVAGLAQTDTGAGSASPTVSGAAVSPIVTGTTAFSGKKPTAKAALAAPLSPTQAAIAAAASVMVPASSISPSPTVAGDAKTAATLATASASAATTATAATATLSRQPTLVAGTASAPASHELAGPEDGTGPREPDGIDPASATVGRPAAMATSGAGLLPPAATALPNAASASAMDTVAAPASGSAGRPSPSPIGSNSPSGATTANATVVFATLAAGERDPGHGAPTTGGDVRPVVATTRAPAASGSMIAPAPSAAVPTAPTPGPAASAIGVVAADGSSQPLANALGPQVVAMVATGRNQVTVHLAPPDLGALTVRVEVQSRDVSAWFASPQPQVQQAVSDALAQLHGALGGAGLNLTGAWVGADVSGGNGRPTAAPMSPRRAAPLAAVADATGAEPATSAEGLSVYA